MIDEKLNRLMDLEADDPDWPTEEWLKQVVKARVRMLAEPSEPFWLRRMYVCLSEYQQGLFGDRKAYDEQLRLSQDLGGDLEGLLEQSMSSEDLEYFFESVGA